MGLSVEKEGVMVGVVGWDSVVVGAVRSMAIVKTDMHYLTGIDIYRCCEGCSARYGHPANQDGHRRCTQACAPHEVQESGLMSQPGVPGTNRGQLYDQELLGMFLNETITTRSGVS